MFQLRLLRRSTCRCFRLLPVLWTLLLLPLLPQPASAATEQSAAADSLPVLVGRSPITLPAPAGFVEASSIVPALRTLGDTLTPPTNRFLAFFLSQDDLQRASGSGQPEMQRYFMVQTLRTLEGTSIGSADFAQVRTLLRAQYSQMLKEAGPNVQQHLDNVSRQLAQDSGTEAPRLKVGQLVGLDVFHDSQDAISLLALGQVQVQRPIDGSVQTREVPLAMAVTTAVVKGKLLYLYAYSRYASAADLAWLKSQVLAWLPQVTAANP